MAVPTVVTTAAMPMFEVKAGLWAITIFRSVAISYEEVKAWSTYGISGNYVLRPLSDRRSAKDVIKLAEREVITGECKDNDRSERKKFLVCREMDFRSIDQT